jgi:hypothetical protein
LVVGHKGSAALADGDYSDLPATWFAAGVIAADEPEAACCDCGRRADEAPREQEWTIWDGRLLYCAECAWRDGIARDQNLEEW